MEKLKYSIACAWGSLEEVIVTVFFVVKVGVTIGIDRVIEPMRNVLLSTMVIEVVMM